MRIKLGHPLLVKTVTDACRGVLKCHENVCTLQAVTHLTTDSREVERGDLFVALQGENGDGHDYIEKAVEAGASLILCAHDRAPCPLRNTCYILVEDTMRALSGLAAAYAGDIPHTTIAVTGSVGKTTARRFLSCVLGQRFHVHESPENYNNLLGVCLTLLTMPQDTEVLIGECGMDGAGQISVLSRLLCPEYAVITNIGVSHMEKLGSRRAICQAKLEIVDGMHGGKVLIEGDDAYLNLYAPCHAVTVSATNAGALYRAIHARCDEHGISFDFVSPAGVYTNMRIPSLGMHTLSCAAFAVALGQILGMTEEEIRAGLMRYSPQFQRQSILHFGRVTVLLDAYNACPDSVKAACASVKLLSESTGGGKIAVLGDMKELGQESEAFHRDIGGHIAVEGFKALIAIGEQAPEYALGATAGGLAEENIRVFPSEAPVEEILAALLPYIGAYDVVLIKGSRAMRLERLIGPLKETLMS